MTSRAADPVPGVSDRSSSLSAQEMGIPDGLACAALFALTRRALSPAGCRELLRAVVAPPAETDPNDPACRTARIALDWLAGEGKRLRPGLTVAAWAVGADRTDLLSAKAGDDASAVSPDTLPESVLRIALALEALHKASLVHDDIEDGDAERYGRPTVHATHGAAMAINVGDYLVGLGYRLAAGEGAALGRETGGRLAHALARAQLALSAGQGAELAWWRDPPAVPMRVADALAVYAGKTAPAFEAALASGLLAADASVPERDIASWARAVGVGYQIRDDLEEWAGPYGAERAADARAGRPTVIDCLARESSPESRRDHAVLAGTDGRRDSPPDLAALRQVYESTGAFARARNLAEEHRLRALAVARQTKPDPLGRLLAEVTALILPA